MRWVALSCQEVRWESDLRAKQLPVEARAKNNQLLLSFLKRDECRFSESSSTTFLLTSLESTFFLITKTQLVGLEELGIDNVEHKAFMSWSIAMEFVFQPAKA